MRADHLHSVHQHKEAVERELKCLRVCRENRFQAEDSRVKRLQESVRNMSLIGDKEEEEEEEDKELTLVLSEEQEQKVHISPPPARLMCVCMCPPPTHTHTQVVQALAAGPPAEVLSMRFNISITRADMSRLTGQQWLNDEVGQSFPYLLPSYPP